VERLGEVLGQNHVAIFAETGGESSRLAWLRAQDLLDVVLVLVRAAGGGGGECARGGGAAHYSQREAICAKRGACGRPGNASAGAPAGGGAHDAREGKRV
jgi:hypothetical protein